MNIDHLGSAAFIPQEVKHFVMRIRQQSSRNGTENEAIGLARLYAFPCRYFNSVIWGIGYSSPRLAIGGADVHTKCTYHSLRQLHHVPPCFMIRYHCRNTPQNYTYKYAIKYSKLLLLHKSVVLV